MQHAHRVRCDHCIASLLGGAQNARYKLLEFMLRAEAESEHKPEILQMIRRERRMIEDDNRLQNLCETVKNLLGKPPEG